MGTPSISTQSTLAIDYSTPTATVIGDFDANSTQLECLSENLRMVQAYAGNEGMRGTRSRRGRNICIGSEAITGSIELQPTPIELDLLFELIMGSTKGTGGANKFQVTETLPVFGVLIDRIARRHVYTSCKISRATFSGSQGGVVSLRLDIEGETEVEETDVMPATLPAIDPGSPYCFANASFTLDADATATEVREFSIVIDNVLDTGRFMNSITRNEIPALDRAVTFSMTVPYTADEVDLHDQIVDGAAGTFTLGTGGAIQTLFDFANLKVPAETPVTGQRGSEIVMSLGMTAFSTAASTASGAEEIEVTHVSS